MFEESKIEGLLRKRNKLIESGFNGRKGEKMIDEAKMLNERAIRNLKKLKNDEDAELAIKALRNQSVLDELLGQGLKIISSNGDISDFDKYFEK